MTPIIVTGHGKFASAMKETIKYILGEQQNIYYIDFDGGMGTEELTGKIREVLLKLDSDEVMFLTDVPGGTPFSTAALLSEDKPKYRVFSGCNLPMIISALEFADEDDLVSVDREILNMAKDGIILFENITQEEVEADEGI